jgi:hypothetical protein
MLLESENNPLEIDRLPGKGRCFIATTDILLGETVFVATPFAAIVDQESKKKVCSHCVKEPSSSDLMTIACVRGCGKLYCSQKCMQSSWEEYHHLECSFTINPSLQNYSKDYTELLIRVLIKMHKNKEHKDIQTIEGMWFDLDQQTNSQLIEYNLASIELDKFVTEKLHDFTFPKVDALFASKLEKKVKTSFTPQRAYLYSLISKEECNSFGLYTFLYKGSKEYRQGFGLALYPSPLFFNHACDPNIGKIYTADGKMQFFAISPIKKGHEACITYIDLDWDLEQRQKTLKEYFCFECVCGRCIEEQQLDGSKSRRNIKSFAFCGQNGCKASLKPKGENEWQCIGCNVTVEV